MSNHCYFVSDLHMFARRSHSHRHETAIRLAASRAGRFVLGGDIFDFRWSTLGSIEQTIDAAIHWLDELITSHPNCEFHFVLGNHDYHARFIARLADLADRRENLSWHRYFLRMGGCIFLHGDVAEWKMNQEKLTSVRERWLDEEPQRELHHWLYDLALMTRIHRVGSYFVFPKRIVAKRISAYLQDIGHGPENGLEHVYFGHTHSAMADYQYGGLTFHNGGAPIKGFDFRIVKTALAA